LDHVFSLKKTDRWRGPVMDSQARDGARIEALDRLVGFRSAFYRCLTTRGDELFELTDPVLCAGGPVTSLPELSLCGVHRRGHGAMYDGLACGQVDVARLRMTVAGLDLPRDGSGRLRFAVDVTTWPRPDAECSPGRSHCHKYCRCNGTRQTNPGWPYSVIAALETGRTSWTHLLDAVRLGPDDDDTEVTAIQIRDLMTRLSQAGAWRQGDPPVLFALDAGYDVIRLSWLLADLPVVLVARIRSNRVMRARPPAVRADGRPGCRPRRGASFRLDTPATWTAPDAEDHDTHRRYGQMQVRAWGRLHPELERRAAWADHPGQLPIIEGTVINVNVDHLPGDRAPKPMWLWCNDPEAADADLDWWWRKRSMLPARGMRSIRSSIVSQTKPVTPSSTISEAAPDRWVSTAVPQTSASIMTRPNGSGLWIGLSRARAEPRSSSLRARPTSPTYSTLLSSNGSTSLWKHSTSRVRASWRQVVVGHWLRALPVLPAWRPCLGRSGRETGSNRRPRYRRGTPRGPVRGE
jgi:hypothetical protein